MSGLIDSLFSCGIGFMVAGGLSLATGSTPGPGSMLAVGGAGVALAVLLAVLGEERAGRRAGRRR